MMALLLVLTPIALVDTTSIVPLCIVILIAMLAGPKPFVTSIALLSGIFVTYFACGLLLLFGLQGAFDEINVYAARVWQDPGTEELILQIALGMMLCGFGLRIARSRKGSGDQTSSSEMTPLQAFVAGAGLTIVGMPAAVPYLAAIDLTLRIEGTSTQLVLAILYYNLVFVAPLVAIVMLRVVLGERGGNILDAVKRFLDRWGQMVIVALLLGLGVILVADGIGWFLGYPLLPL